MRIFPKKKIKLEINKPVGIIELTETALDNGVNDNFNKVIRIRDGVRIENNNIIWGRVIEEIPFSEESLYSIQSIKEIPIVERRFSESSFLEDATFGGVIR